MADRTRRLQLADDARVDPTEERVARESRSVAPLVPMLDAASPDVSPPRAGSGRRIVEAEPMPVDDTPAGDDERERLVAELEQPRGA